MSKSNYPGPVRSYSVSTLRAKLVGRVVVIGIGNTLKSDDGAGPVLAKRLQGRLNAEVIDAETVLENFLCPVINLKPDTVLIIDAVRFDAEPGDLKIFLPADLPVGHFSTHGMSPGLFMKLLNKVGISNVILLGIQPHIIELGQKLSNSVEDSLNTLEAVLKSILGERESLPGAPG